MAKTIKKIVYFTPLLSLLVLAAIMNTTSPLQSGPLGVLVVFILSYIFIASLFYLVVSNAIYFVNKSGKHNFKIKGKLHNYSAVISLGIVLLFALNSLGQLGIQDFVLVGLLTGLGLFYFSRTT